MGYKPGKLLLCLGMLAVLAGSCSHAPAGPEVSGGLVRFQVEAPAASNVILVLLPSRSLAPGTREYPATVSGEGVWSASLPLEPGEYRYFFMVDDSVRVATRGTRLEADDFGGITGVLTVEEEPDGTLRIY